MAMGTIQRKKEVSIINYFYWEWETHEDTFKRMDTIVKKLVKDKNVVKFSVEERNG